MDQKILDYVLSHTCTNFTSQRNVSIFPHITNKILDAEAKVGDLSLQRLRHNDIKAKNSKRNTYL